MGRKNYKNRFNLWNKNYVYDFQQCETIKYHGESIFTRKASRIEAEEEQSNLSKNMAEFDNKSRPRIKKVKIKKKYLWKFICPL